LAKITIYGEKDFDSNLKILKNTLHNNQENLNNALNIKGLDFIFSSQIMNTPLYFTSIFLNPRSKQIDLRCSISIDEIL
jgi:hypothetical protein